MTPPLHVRCKGIESLHPIVEFTGSLIPLLWESAGQLTDSEEGVAVPASNTQMLRCDISGSEKVRNTFLTSSFLRKFIASN
jgi:hypothetical protein